MEVREHLLDALGRIGLPMEIELLRQTAAVLGDATIERLSCDRLLRDEAGRAEPRLVAACSAATQRPVRGWVASTAQPEASRLVGTRTPRVAFLRALLALLDASPAAASSELAIRLARTVPGAMSPPGAAPDPDLARLRGAVCQELEQLASAEQREREERPPHRPRIPGSVP